jgi:hypothetical protein
VILGGSYLIYALLRRDKTVRVYKRQGSTEAPSEQRESSQTTSEGEPRSPTPERPFSKEETPSEAPSEQPSWWRRLFGG